MWFHPDYYPVTGRVIRKNNKMPMYLWTDKPQLIFWGVMYSNTTVIQICKRQLACMDAWKMFIWQERPGINIIIWSRISGHLLHILVTKLGAHWIQITESPIHVTSWSLMISGIPPNNLWYLFFSYNKEKHIWTSLIAWITRFNVGKYCANTKWWYVKCGLLNIWVYFHLMKGSDNCNCLFLSYDLSYLTTYWVWGNFFASEIVLVLSYLFNEGETGNIQWLI